MYQKLYYKSKDGGFGWSDIYMNKCYAIKNGRITGIVYSWDECRRSVSGFSGAEFKGFDNAQDAERWLVSGEYNQHKPDKPKKKKKVVCDYIIYTDGSCLNNPGPGGYAAVVFDNYSKETMEFVGGEDFTTNNRMELSAAIAGLSKVPENSVVFLYTDSKYLRDAFASHWIDAWKYRNWTTAAHKAVKNQDLWEILDKLNSTRKIYWNWVKGHANVTLNERCNELAQEEARKHGEDKT